MTLEALISSKARTRIAALTFAAVVVPLPAAADAFIFSTGSPDGRIGTLSRPNGSPGLRPLLRGPMAKPPFGSRLTLSDAFTRRPSQAGCPHASQIESGCRRANDQGSGRYFYCCGRDLRDVGDDADACRYPYRMQRARSCVLGCFFLNGVSRIRNGTLRCPGGLEKSRLR